jgi:hypothetical protein
MCAHDADTGVVVAFGANPASSYSDSGSHQPPDTGYAWGLRASHPNADSVALQFDWGRGFTPDTTAYHVHLFSMITTASETDPCACPYEQFQAYIDPPSMVMRYGGELIDEIKETQEWEEDSQLDGFFSGGGYYAIRADGSPFGLSIDRAVPTLLLRVVGTGRVSTTGFEARIGGVELTEGVDYLATPSDVPDDGFYLFLARSLPANVVLDLAYEPE